MMRKLVLTLETVTVAVLCVLLITTPSAHAQTETVLYNFTGGSDGGYPEAQLTADSAGNFYGTTNAGGPSGFGTVFELSPNGSGGWSENVLYGFVCDPYCTNGGRPSSDVIFDNVGNLYGTAYDGGATGYGGVVFELIPSAGNWTETVLFNFGDEGANGTNPASGLIMDKAGNLYGTTYQGGAYGTGAVYELSPSGAGWTEQVIYSSPYPVYAGLSMDPAGNLFGASVSTVFELSPNGDGGWNPIVIHTFAGPPKDGNNAAGTPVLDKLGNLYGTTTNGGRESAGTVYKLSPGKKGKWTEKILYSFKGVPKNDGSEPFAGIVFDAAGNIYGTTTQGGKYNSGTVFKLLAPIGKGGYKEKVLWSFDGSDGSSPVDSLILDSAGNLYGATNNGGPSNAGVVFEITP